MTKDNNSIDRTLDIDSDKKTYDEFGNLNEGVEIMSVTKIVANPNQPRKKFDETALEELAVSIKNVGIIQPIVVCPTGDDTYVIVAGERRFRANKIAGNTTIPVIVKNYTRKQIKEILI